MDMDSRNDTDYTDYQIALSPDLGITAEEFASAWNDDPDARDLGTIHFSEEKVSFIDPLLAAALLSIPASVASSTLYDLLKSVVARLRHDKSSKPDAKRHVHIEQTTKPDGTVIVVVDVDEG
jgi:hypothetical protein